MGLVRAWHESARILAHSKTLPRPLYVQPTLASWSAAVFRRFHPRQPSTRTLPDARRPALPRASARMRSQPGESSKHSMISTAALLAPLPAGVANDGIGLALFPTLIRFDAVYHGHFKCNLRRIVDYPNLWPYLASLPTRRRRWDGELRPHQATLLRDARAH